MLRNAYCLLVINILVALIRSGTYGHLTFARKQDLDDVKCTGAEVVFIKYLSSRIKCAANCKHDLRCRSMFYNTLSNHCVACNKAYNSMSGLVTETGTEYFNIKIDDTLRVDCKQILEDIPNAPSDVYSVLPPGAREAVTLTCDMDTDGGGWTVLQYRHNGTVSFDRSREEFVNGFGSPFTEYWLGLESIHRLTKDTNSTIFMLFVDADDNVAVESGNGFKVDEGPIYKLRVGNAVFYNDSTEELGFILGLYNGVGFSSPDMDNDWDADKHCAVKFQSSWWFRFCSYLNPNGDYITPGTISDQSEGLAGIVHQGWRDVYSLKSTKLMFRRL